VKYHESCRYHTKLGVGEQASLQEKAADAWWVIRDGSLGSFFEKYTKWFTALFKCFAY
jgi:hypothetical protein